MSANDYASGSGTASDSAADSGAAGDSSPFSGRTATEQAARMIYEAEVSGLTDYWVSPALATPWNGIVDVELTDFAVDDPTVNFTLNVIAMTRHTGKSWKGIGAVQPPLGLSGPELIAPLINGGVYGALDELLIIAYLQSATGDGSPATVEVDPSGGVPGASKLIYSSGIAGLTAFGDLFSIEGVDPGEPGQIARFECIDDPDAPGHFLGRAVYGTDGAGAITSNTLSLGNLDATGLCVVSQEAGTVEPCVPFAKAPFAGGNPGTISPTSFTVTIS